VADLLRRHLLLSCAGAAFVRFLSDAIIKRGLVVRAGNIQAD